MSTLFVAGAGTEIGKTYVTAALTRALRASGRPVRALKPVASGVPDLSDPDFSASDTALLLAAQDLPVTPETVAAMTPWRFAAPLAPDLAAAREGRSLALADLVAWCETAIAAPAPGTAVLIEGVGGLMSPLTAEATGLAWLKALRLPVLLVSGSYLGAISHALTAIETLHHHAVDLRAVVVSETPGAPTPPETVAEAIARHAGVRVLCVARGGGFPAEGLDVVPA
ncbi:dethiobiotin synthase [Methylobacterium nodulans]|uniref:ATP-dependent dethiobiotin synthetase BioD n=1 Tax=Methylobacterium nodulans (strain LMG 21967 / CNCM I-2342 / ORS 2060) TaxID=460265 RepID=BIOD_METNO|nr:dethiobiotin synthase [Methylobacterium nodulans]B8IBW1.1 RecName: Full=ATP-dependent dethiobiotin synthetase BioD; AltName: Full=DTB synthetase; Short=DTBS; AltName: Full=Dethiobiotin synthase [Methylobacterium nodulans ORS 2060]ACL61143.1 dethiobiotin synthase [Methylobacterium nodulans ORS 2060]